MRRRALSFVELVVTSGVLVILLGVIMALWTGGVKMNLAAQSSVALQNALLLEETIFQDFQQLGIDPESGTTHLVSETCLSFYRTVFDGPVMRLRPVRYRRVPSAGGLYNLERTEIGPGSRRSTKVFASTPLLAMEFDQIEDPVLKRRYLAVYLLAADNDRTPSTAPVALRDRTGCRSLLARLPLPGMVRNPALAAVIKISRESEEGLIPLAL